MYGFGFVCKSANKYNLLGEEVSIIAVYHFCRRKCGSNDVERRRRELYACGMVLMQV